MVKACAVVNCFSNRYFYEGIYMYPLPRDNPDLLAAWMRACRRPEGYVPPAYMCVCEKHFEPSVVTRVCRDVRITGKVLPGAVPTLNLDCEPPPVADKPPQSVRPDKDKADKSKRVTKSKKKIREHDSGRLKKRRRKGSIEDESDVVRSSIDKANTLSSKIGHRQILTNIEEVVVDGGGSAEVEFEKENFDLNLKAYCRLCCVKYESGCDRSLNSLGEDETVTYLLSISLIESSTLSSAQQVCEVCYEQFTNFLQYLKICHRGQLNLVLQLSNDHKFKEEISAVKEIKKMKVEVDSSNNESEAESPDDSDQQENDCSEAAAGLTPPDLEGDPETAISFIDQLITEMDQLKFKKHKHKPGKDYECNDCGETFQRSNVHRNHRKQCSLIGTPDSLRNKRYDCTLCPRTSIQSLSGYRYHLWNIHRGMIDANGNNDHVPEELMKMYMRKSYPCPLCKDTFGARTLLRYHLLTHKRILQGGPGFRKRISGQPKDSHSSLCNFCGKTINSLAALELHMKFHKKQKDVKCDKCEKCFYQVHDMQIHMESVHLNIKYPCDVCGKVLTTKKFLVNHKRLHDESTLKRCPHCPKAYTHNSALKYHINKHHNAVTSQTIKAETTTDSKQNTLCAAIIAPTLIFPGSF